METKSILSIQGVTKEFPGVKALDNISLDVFKGEIHGIVGENGAGKSTLMKILSGVYRMEQGELFIDGSKVEIENPVQSQNMGISIIYQELNLVNTLSVAENIYLGRLKDKKPLRSIYKMAAEHLQNIGIDIEPHSLVGKLSVSERQFVEIAKALSFQARIIIMDEPTTTLTTEETKRLFEIINRLKSTGVTVLYISHKLDEIMELCDRVSIMRDGKLVKTCNKEQIDRNEMIALMVGRTLDMEYPPRENLSKETVMQVKNLNANKVFDVNFELKKGEILGLVGLVGSGRTELVRALFGADKKITGEILIEGKRVNIRNPMDAKRHGIALVTEDRKQLGLLLEFSVGQNITMSSLKKFCFYGFMNRKREEREAGEYVEKLAIKTPSLKTKVLNLSGGNQQKCIIARWLETEPKILILDEPTRGVDVGAKYEIYLLMKQIVANGGSIIMISSELNEVLNMSNRVLVMREGRLTGEFDPEKVSAETIMRSAIG